MDRKSALGSDEDVKGAHVVGFPGISLTALPGADTELGCPRDGGKARRPDWLAPIGGVRSIFRLHS